MRPATRDIQSSSKRGLSQDFLDASYEAWKSSEVRMSSISSSLNLSVPARFFTSFCMLTVIVYDRMRKPPVDPLSLLLEDDNPIVQEWCDTIDQKPYEDTWSKSGLAIEVLFSLENVRGSGIRAPNAIRFQSGQPPLVFYLQKSTESSPRRSRARNYPHVGTMLGVIPT